MNLSLMALVASGLALGAIAASEKSPEPAARPELAHMVAADTRQDGERYRLRSMDNLSCQIIRGAAASDGVYTLRADAACDRLLPGLSRVRFWQEHDGLIVLGGNLADDLISFAVADGVSYESFRPASALISLTADD
jgi:hypothetical protein